MPSRRKRLLFGLPLILLLGAGAAGFFFFGQDRRPVEERPVRVIQIRPEGAELWSLPREAVILEPLSGRAAIIRLTYFRAERLEVRPKEKNGERIYFQLPQIGR